MLGVLLMAGAAAFGHGESCLRSIMQHLFAQTPSER
jgi:hypothetical protein